MPNNKLTRRDILKATGTALPAGLIAPALFSPAADASDNKMPMRTLGRTGVKVSLLTLGCGHLRKSFITSSEAGDIIERALELGVNSIDTAPTYDESEDFLGEALKGKRDKVFLATKTEEQTYDKAWELLQTSLKRLQTDYIDLVYLHNFGYDKYFPDAELTLSPKGALSALREAKKQGLIRHIGVSGHLYPSRWKQIHELDDIDVYLCVTNFISRHQYNFEEKAFGPARKKNLGMVGMKILGGAGNWKTGAAKFVDRIDPCLRYVLSLPGLSTANIGFRSVDELETVAKKIIQLKPFSTEEMTAFCAEGKKLAAEMKPLYGEPVA